MQSPFEPLKLPVANMALPIAGYGSLGDDSACSSESPRTWLPERISPCGTLASSRKECDGRSIFPAEALPNKASLLHLDVDLASDMDWLSSLTSAPSRRTRPARSLRRDKQGLQGLVRGQKARLNADAVMAQHITTLMIHNIPTAITQEDVRDELDHCGFGVLFDFMYVPYNLKSECICGYAFINFLSSDAAALLVSMWDQRLSLCGKPTTRPMFFTAADVQGFDAHMDRLAKASKRNLRDPRFKPVVRQVPQRGYGKLSQIACPPPGLEHPMSSVESTGDYHDGPAYIETDLAFMASPFTSGDSDFVASGPAIPI